MRILSVLVVFKAHISNGTIARQSGVLYRQPWNRLQRVAASDTRLMHEHGGRAIMGEIAAKDVHLQIGAIGAVNGRSSVQAQSAHPPVLG